MLPRWCGVILQVLCQEDIPIMLNWHKELCPWSVCPSAGSQKQSLLLAAYANIMDWLVLKELSCCLLLTQTPCITLPSFTYFFHAKYCHVWRVTNHQHSVWCCGSFTPTTSIPLVPAADVALDSKKVLDICQGGFGWKLIHTQKKYSASLDMNMAPIS